MTVATRTPPGVLDALATVAHGLLCMSARDPDRPGHTWRDHSGTGYRDLGKQLMAALDERGCQITRKDS